MLVAGVIAALAGSVLTRDAEHRLDVTPDRVRPGQVVQVRGQGIAVRGRSVRLDRRAGDGWEPMYDLSGEGDRYFASRVTWNGQSPGLLKGYALESTMRVRIPDVPPGRYRMKYFISVKVGEDDWESRTIDDAFDVVARPAG